MRWGQGWKGGKVAKGWKCVSKTEKHKQCWTCRNGAKFKFPTFLGQSKERVSTALSEKVKNFKCTKMQDFSRLTLLLFVTGSYRFTFFIIFHISMKHPLMLRFRRQVLRTKTLSDLSLDSLSACPLPVPPTHDPCPAQEPWPNSWSEVITKDSTKACRSITYALLIFCWPRSG